MPAILSAIGENENATPPSQTLTLGPLGSQECASSNASPRSALAPRLEDGGVARGLDGNRSPNPLEVKKKPGKKGVVPGKLPKVGVIIAKAAPHRCL